jgi:hypothetical protein
VFPANALAYSASLSATKKESFLTCSPEFRKTNSRNFESGVYEEEDSDTTSAERTDATKNDVATLLFSTSLKGVQKCHQPKEVLVSSKSEI